MTDLAPPVVLLAVAEGDVGIVVLGPPTEGARAVLEARVVATREFRDVVGGLANVYGPRGACWGCASDDEFRRLTALGGGGTVGTFCGPQGRVLGSLPRHLRIGRVADNPPPGPSDEPAVVHTPLAWRRVWALTSGFRLHARWKDRARAAPAESASSVPSSPDPR